MFTRYNINDLYLAHVVVYSEDSKSSYGYLTILKKEQDSYIDLQNMNRVITSSMIYRIDALNKYYTQDGRKKTITRKNALNISKVCHEKIYNNRKVKSM